MSNISTRITICCGSGGSGIVIRGKYLNDQAAIDAGWAIGDWYLLAKGNDYAMKEDTLVKISEPETP